MKRVAVISFAPLDGGRCSDEYTLNTVQAIQHAGDRCMAFARAAAGPFSELTRDRLKTMFVEVDTGGSPVEYAPFADVLMTAAECDTIWVHQYLGYDALFDVIATATSDCPLLLTNLGYQPLADYLANVYQPASNHFFVETSAYEAAHSRRYGSRCAAVSAGVWAEEIEPEHNGAGAAVAISRDTVEVSQDKEGPQAKSPGRPIFKAVARRVLPVVADTPPCREIMECLELADLLYPEQNRDAMEQRILAVTALSAAERAGRVDRAQAQIRARYCWDDFWPRVLAATGL